MQINLVSDTITKPSPEMLEFMMAAELGDDVFSTDPTVNELEDKMANMFGKESAIFCPSGTMTNQIAVKLHTRALDELICDESSHVFQYETGGYAYNARVGINLIRGQFGKITAEQIDKAIKADHDWLPSSSLVVLENSTNKGGGNYYTLDEIRPIRELCQKRALKLHLDGARIFNVLVETKESTIEVGQLFDSISVCLSKGLGAPIGSVLIGSKEDIRRARRFRKVMGGGMRQVGIIAAGGIYALDNNISRLKEDNDRAKELGQFLSGLEYVEEVLPVKTNIVIFKLAQESAESFLKRLKQKGIDAAPFGEMQVRFVTHMHFGNEDLEKTKEILSSMA